MTGMERQGAERMLRSIILDLQAHGHAVTAEAVRRTGKRILDHDDSGAVFPAAAELPAIGDEATVKASKA